MKPMDEARVSGFYAKDGKFGGRRGDRTPGLPDVIGTLDPASPQSALAMIFEKLVDGGGIEPPASSLRTMRSPS